MIETTMRLITAIILLISAILGGFGSFPWWVVPILTVVLLVLAMPQAYSWFSVALQKRAKQRKEQQLVETRWGELRKLATELQEMSLLNMTDFVGTVCNVAKRAVPEKQNDYNPNDSKWPIHMVVTAIVSLLDVQKKDKASFTASAQLLETVFSFWHRGAQKLARSLREDLEKTSYRLNPYEKEEFNRTRKWHTDLMDEYVRFAKTVNANFGERVLTLTTQDPLPDLW